MQSKHRVQPRYYIPDTIYYLVTKTHNNFPYFKEAIFCELLIEELKICKDLKKFKLYGFCIIYDHLNLLIQPGDKYNISQIIQSIKKETARDINYIIQSISFHPVGDIPECRLRGEQYSRRYNKKFITPKLIQYQQQFIKKYGPNQTIFPPFKWQKSFYDYIVRPSHKDLENHYNYCVYNYLKHGLPENWQYNSENYPKLIDDII